MLAARDTVNGAFDIDVWYQPYRANQGIPMLTLIATVLLPVTLIVGLFGVNLGADVHGIPIEMPVGFAPMLRCIGLESAPPLGVFRRRDWFCDAVRL